MSRVSDVQIEEMREEAPMDIVEFSESDLGYTVRELKSLLNFLYQQGCDINIIKAIGHIQLAICSLEEKEGF